MELEAIVKQYDLNLLYAQALVEDVEEHLMAHTPAPGLENHPAWTLGHLVTGSALTVEDMGGEYEVPDGWSDLFLRRGPGDPRKPNPDQSLYPSKSELISELGRQHERVKTRLQSLNEEDLNKRFDWRYGHYMPVLRDIITFMCTTHEAMHLGQLAAWRRAMDLPSALARL